RQSLVGDARRFAGCGRRRDLRRLPGLTRRAARSDRRVEGGMIITEKIASNIQIALDTLRANKLRSALTILGVVIGVSTVMTMAAIVQGIQDQIVRTIEIAGPTTFYVVKVFSQTPVNTDRLPKWVRVCPDL